MIICSIIIFTQRKTQSKNRNFTTQQHHKQSFARKIISILLIIIFLVLYSLDCTLSMAMIVACTDIAVFNIFLISFRTFLTINDEERRQKNDFKNRYL